MGEHRRIAIIAVHGVGHHKAGEASHAAADLLSTQGYSTFVETRVRVPVRPVPSPGHGRDERKWYQFLDERADLFVPPAEAKPKELAQQVQDEGPEARQARMKDLSIEYMTEQLDSYFPRASDLVYDTAYLCAKRLDPKRPAEVHVFDMYWTDISRVSTAGLRMIGELYQLLFYVCSLGRKSLEFACAAYPGNRSWDAFRACHSHAERLLTVWIPGLNLCQLGLGILLVPQMLYGMANPLAVPIGIGVTFAVLVLGALVVMRRTFTGPAWPWMFVIVGALSALAGVFLPKLLGAWMPLVFVEMTWIVASGVIVALAKIYDRRRPGAAEVAVMVVVLVAAILAAVPFFEPFDKTNIWLLGVYAGIWLYCLLSGLWAAFIALAFLASMVGYVVSRNGKEPEKRRAAWTANLSLVLPGFVILLLNLAIWWGVVGFGESVIGPRLKEQIEALLIASTPWSFGALMGIAAACLVWTAWGLVPNILLEVWPRNRAQPAAELGLSLNAFFWVARISGEIVRWIVIFAIPVSVLVVEYFPGWIPRDVVSEMRRFSNQYTGWIGLALVAMVAGPGPLRVLALGLRTAIDVAIDVANWMRLYPVDENPRARICARYYSLLNYILAKRDPETGKGYDAIVIFAHSQGTVISADLLRYFEKSSVASRPEGMADIPVYLFTMGCPLRQLYGQRFPHQYGWCRDEPPTWPGLHPDPADLRVAEWVNAYRSGDYVGRFLWHPYAAPSAWNTTPMHVGARRELCIGPGAHTHYWDDTALTVAKELDRLV